MRLLPSIAALLLAASVAHAEGFAQSFDVEPGERLRIELASGDVDVFAIDGDELRIEADARGLGASAVGFVVTREAGEIVLRSRTERWTEWLAAGPHVRVRAWVPKHQPLAVETSGQVVASDGGARLPERERVAQRPAAIARNLP